MSFTQRTEQLIGRDGQEKLSRSAVAIFGLGGVGSYVCEALTRCGIGRLLLVDGDVVDETNINRQLYALSDTVGQSKATLAKERCLRINPHCDIDARQVFYDKDSAAQFDLSRYDYVVDAIDSVSSKLLLIETTFSFGVKVISCMGAGNKLDPTAFRVAYVEDTKVCPLARVMRRELKTRGISRVKCVYSEELPVQTGSRAPASIAFVPSAAGLVLASAVVRDLLNNN